MFVLQHYLVRESGRGAYQDRQDVIAVPNIKNGRFKTLAQGIFNPYEKDGRLYEKLLRNWTNIGDLVIDNCSGSGSLLAKCIQMSRRCVSFDPDIQMATLIRERLSAEVINLKVNYKKYLLDQELIDEETDLNDIKSTDIIKHFSPYVESKFNTTGDKQFLVPYEHVLNLQEQIKDYKNKLKAYDNAYRSLGREPLVYISGDTTESKASSSVHSQSSTSSSSSSSKKPTKKPKKILCKLCNKRYDSKVFDKCGFPACKTEVCGNCRIRSNNIPKLCACSEDHLILAEATLMPKTKPADNTSAETPVIPETQQTPGQQVLFPDPQISTQPVPPQTGRTVSKPPAVSKTATCKKCQQPTCSCAKPTS